MRRTCKLNPTLFEAMRDGRKRFDVLRGVREGDVIRYEEHDFAFGLDTGRWLEFVASHVDAVGDDLGIASLLLARAPREVDAAPALVPLSVAC